MAYALLSDLRRAHRLTLIEERDEVMALFQVEGPGPDSRLCCAKSETIEVADSYFYDPVERSECFPIQFTPH